MAIPLTAKSFRESLAPLLDAAFDDGWAVHWEFDQANRRYVIGKVERWDSFTCGLTSKPRLPNIMPVKEARDEMDAYMQAMRRLEASL